MSLRVVSSFVSILVILALTACGTATTAPQGDSSVSSETSGEAAAEGSDAPEDEVQSGDAGASSKPKAAGEDAAVPAVFDFVSQTVDGAPFSGADLAGTPAVLWFWAPWCPTCRGQIDDVSAAAGQYGGDVAFVGVGGLDGGEAIADFAADVPAEQVTQLSDPDGAVWRHFGITEQSTYVVLDADGETVASGYLEAGELLDVTGDLAGR